MNSSKDRFDQLLAKSQTEQAPWLKHTWLPVHLEDVYRAAGQVLDATGDEQLAAVGLCAETWRDRFRRVVLLAAAVHDLGKANDHFQRAVRAANFVPQGLRHEWVTTLMLARQELSDWLRPAGMDDDDLRIVHWAVNGHHARHDRSSPPRSDPANGGGKEITFLMGHADFAECLRRLAEWFGLGQPPTLTNVTRKLVHRENVFVEIARIHSRHQEVWNKSLSTELRRFTAVAKNCLVAADISGSALPRELPPSQRDTWIVDGFRIRPTVEELDAILTDKMDGKPLRPFQEAVAQSHAQVTFVRAGCGTGKTAAAYRWARVRAPGRRLWFCYPTTGTATEGFRDYLTAELDSVVGMEDDITTRRAKFGARLFHGRRDVDVEMLAVRDEPEDENRARLESFETWSTPIAACTVDTVLGLVQNNRRGLYAWPALAGSAFVFDEIHAYDDKLFGALLRFLSDLPGLPVLLMTASLPRARHERLRRQLSEAGRSLSEIPGPDELECLQRYHRLPLGEGADPLELVQAELAANGKVLWVCNTVDRAISFAERAEQAGLDPLLYHSRFRYEDRVERHNKVIQVFRKPGRALAICTQVAEMSLDLSATLLVTDLAPVPALIQRLGRLNRRANPCDPTRPFVMVVPEGPLPYEAAQLDAARAWLEILGPGPISQQQLASAWEKQDAEQKLDLESAWLDGGPATTVLELRGASPGITVVLEEDKDTQDVARVALPMPPPPKTLNWRALPTTRKGRLPIVGTKEIRYDKQRGGQWIK